MKKIFISYKRADKDIVMPIVDRINSELGEICWIDLDGIETNSIFETKIVKAIEDSKIFLFMFSQRHKGIAIEDEFDDDLNLVRHQDWTIRELNLADNKYKTLVNLDNSSLDICPLIRGRFQSANYTNATDPRQMDNLIDKIGKLLKIGRNTQHQDKSSKHVLTPSNDEQSGSPRDAKESDENNMEAFETGKNTDKQDVVEKDDASYSTVHEYTKEAKAARLFEDALSQYKSNNYGEALSLFKKAAEDGHVEAMRWIGLFYEQGRCVDVDEAKAIEYYQKAAWKGSVKAQFLLATMYAQKEFYSQAAEWYSEAAKSGHMRSQYLLGLYYMHGKGGLPQNIDLAYEWIKKAAEQGHEKAIEAIKQWETR